VINELKKIPEHRKAEVIELIRLAHKRWQFVGGPLDGHYADAITPDWDDECDYELHSWNYSNDSLCLYAVGDDEQLFFVGFKDRATANMEDGDHD
jgi:hypothetical protein